MSPRCHRQTRSLDALSGDIRDPATGGIAPGPTPLVLSLRVFRRLGALAAMPSWLNIGHTAVNHLAAAMVGGAKFQDAVRGVEG